jgi:hypothetical protein
MLRSLLNEIEKLAKKTAREFERNPVLQIFSSLPTGGDDWHQTECGIAKRRLAIPQPPVYTHRR